MKMSLSTDDYLQISGIKHFRFCRRRWALVHIEQQWDENALTVSGHLMHERVHDDGFTEKRGRIILSRGMPVRSDRLGITGVCDMVELIRDDENGISIHGREGKYLVNPVEYKHGKPDDADLWQLCAQVICLEEMNSLMKRGYTPKVRPQKFCRSCSMYEICQPGLSKRGSASEYVKGVLAEE